ncbi:hypothetical protein AURDEDRAFT_177654, partial [Auricularia subglabra TFB-10046 SS5]
MPQPLPPVEFQDRSKVTDSVVSAIEAIHEAHRKAVDILSQDESDYGRLNAFISSLEQRTFRLIVELEKMECMTTDWVKNVAHVMGSLLPELKEAREGSKLAEDRKTVQHSKVKTIYTGRPGRPRKEVSSTLLENSFHPGRMVQQAPLARELHIHRNTLRKSMKRQGFGPPAYSDITEEELDMLFTDFHEQNARRGLLAFTGHLREHNIRVQQQRLINCIRRCCPLERALEPIIAA